MKTSDEILYELNAVVPGWELKSTTCGVMQIYSFFNSDKMVDMDYVVDINTYFARHRQIKDDDGHNLSGGSEESAYLAYIGLTWKIRFKVKKLLEIVNHMNKDKKNGNTQ